MQIERAPIPTAPTPPRASCPLECDDCTGLCLSVWMMLTPAEQDAVYQQSRRNAAAGYC